MQTPGRPTPRTLVLMITATLAATLAFANAAVAQQSSAAQENPAAPEGSTAQAPAGQAGQTSVKPELTPAQQALAQDFYRAEFVILERRIEPSDVNEKMASRLPAPPNLEAEEILRHTDETGATRTTLDLVPRKELHLSRAAERLQNSGQYRILLAAGWYQAFPPDFQGEPLWVAVGDWLPDAGHTDVQGMITIDRQRYLHVNVQLNHWLPKSPSENLLGIDLNAETPTQPRPPRIAIRPAGIIEEAPSSQESPLQRKLVSGLNWPRAELLTWIQETRRMRSEEVHFLDSPTLGVLIFFKKIEPQEAAPLILKRGLTGEQEEPQVSPRKPQESS